MKNFHEKIHYSDSQDALLRANAGHMAVLLDFDKLTKSASTSIIPEEQLRAMRPDKDHFGVLYVGMGSFEKYSFNRNGDAWLDSELRDHTHTFVSHGHYFREHRNRNPELAIGQIKLAAYDQEMGRNEILVWGHRKKAEQEYERAKSGHALSCSMSAKVPIDVCSCCGNEARNRGEYCSHLSENMTRWMPEFGKYAYAENPNPTFFDLSDVRNPADRIAHFLRYDFGDLQKAASAGALGGSQLGELEGLSLPGTSLQDLGRASIHQRLVNLEDTLASGEFASRAKAAARAMFSRRMSDGDIQALRQHRPEALFAKLARAGVMLPLPEFFAYVSGMPMADVEKADWLNKCASALPGIFKGAMLTGFTAPDIFEAGAMDLMDVHCGCDPLQPVLDRMVERYNCQAGPVQGRLMATPEAASEEIKPIEKSAALSPDELQLAESYALYKISALHDMERFGLAPTERDLREMIFVAHNYVAHR